MNKVSLEIVAISHSVSQSHNYAVILGEVEGSRRLPIVIGGFEAQGIAIAVEKMTPNRPLTHDLFKATLDNFGIIIREVVINDLLDGIFYAQLICDQNGDISVIDSRTSDAIAMAVRFNCPIYTYDFILDQAGVEMDSDKNEPLTPTRSMQKPGITSLSIDELESQLEKAIEMEDYETAAKLRDEITNRKSN
ncbi:MAG: bifunctional nuclease family protein [Saprospiraceae bacterium]|nr:bifunctional nuclease family protein [Saprospiraceae bacterium]MBK7223067.1 bifunctional nuclease family protein [Saprospiraceae bacterium]MBK7789406.1 bifunctional nuclease family protein [Saprospiraceae bacterium]MBK8112799.1 bifunctional nuclease family protein [Saprospiraceae bacterium]MBK8852362.1 bifunctional nuclease family protein [Saprospiraceae bacterium]